MEAGEAGELERLAGLEAAGEVAGGGGAADEGAAVEAVEAVVGGVAGVGDRGRHGDVARGTAEAARYDGDVVDTNRATRVEDDHEALCMSGRY